MLTDPNGILYQYHAGEEAMAEAQEKLVNLAKDTVETGIEVHFKFVEATTEAE